MKLNSPTAHNGFHSPKFSVGRITNTYTLLEVELRDEFCHYPIALKIPSGAILSVNAMSRQLRFSLGRTATRLR